MATILFEWYLDAVSTVFSEVSLRISFKNPPTSVCRGEFCPRSRQLQYVTYPQLYTDHIILTLRILNSLVPAA